MVAQDPSGRTTAESARARFDGFLEQVSATPTRADRLHGELMVMAQPAADRINQYEARLARVGRADGRHRLLQLAAKAALKVGELQTFTTLNNETQKNKRSAAQNYYSQGLAQLSRDDYARAASFFEKAAEIDPNYAEAFYQAGFCYGMLARHTDALKFSKQAARLRPEWAATFINIGASSFALGQFKDAAEAYRTATKLDTENADAQYALGLSLGRLNRADEEILAYKRAVALKPDYANAFEQLGLAYFKQKRYNDSIAAFEQLKTYKPDAKTYNYLGESYLENGKTVEAVEAFNNAVNYNPDFQKARYNLGKAYIKNGDRDSASVQYEILRGAKSDWADKLYVLLNP